jgi:hypothetical protein
MKKYILASLLLLPALASKAQFELNAPFMSNVPQAYYANPALMPEYKVIIGFPMFASVQGSVRNTGFSVRDFMVSATDANRSMANLGGSMSKRNYAYAGTSFDLFFLRIKARNSFFSFNVTEHINTRIGYSRDFIRLLTEGNMPEQNAFKDNTVSLKGMSANAVHYREFALGYTRQMDKLTIGGRGRLLFGLANLHTQRMQGSLVTDPDNAFALSGQVDFRVNTSLDPQVYGKDTEGSTSQSYNESVKDYLFNTSNLGFALDAAASYKLNDKVTFTAIARDMGFINWRSHTTNYSSNATMEFTGLPMRSGMDMGAYMDSLGNSVDVVKTQEGYRTYLSGQSYFLAQYQLARNTRLGGGLFMEYHRGVYPALTTNIQQRLGRFMNLQLSYSVQNRTYNNLGAGVSVKLLPLQLYFMSDNLTALMRPASARNANFRVGANWVFGNTLKPAKEKKAKGIDA